MFKKIDFIEPVQRALTFSVVALTIVVGYLGLIHFGPKIERAYFPVVKDAGIVTVERAAPDQFALKIAFTKDRACEFTTLSWYVGHPEQAFSATEVAFSAHGTRPLGRNIAGRWLVTIPDGTDWTFGIVRHECGLPWTSESVIGPFSVRSLLDGAVSIP